MKYLRPLLLVVVVSVGPRAFALDADAEQAERARIKSERAQVEAAYAQRERECRTRFVVTSCVDEARGDRRQALERLRLQQELLDEQQRKQRAAQRMDEIRTKVSGDDAKHREADAPGRRKDKLRVQVPAASSPDGTSPAMSAPVLPASAAPAHRMPVDEAKRTAEYDKRQQEAQAHREAVAQRNAERAARGKAPAKPLPVPSAASAASASH